MKKFVFSLLALAGAVGVSAESLTATWQFSEPDNLGEVVLSGSDVAKSLVSTDFEKGSKIAEIRQIIVSTAEGDLTPVNYDPPFSALKPTTKVSSRSAGHCVSFIITPATGHSFKPTSVSFDAMKVGTDGGSIDACYTIGTNAEKVFGGGIQPARNRVSTANPNACSHHEFTFADAITYGEPFKLTLYIMNINGIDNTSPKEIGFRNVTIKGAVDEEIMEVGSYVKGFTFSGAKKLGQTTTLDLMEYVAQLKNGEIAAYPDRLFGEPTDFQITTVEGCTSEYTYSEDGHSIDVNVLKGDETAINFGVRFKVTNRNPKGEAKPLNRGLMAVSLDGANMGKGNLVSWRHREQDGRYVKYKLYRGDATSQNTALNRGLYIIDRTNIEDPQGTADSYYRLDTYDGYGNLIESEVSKKTWDSQTLYIPTETPIDNYHDATYTPNDASFCDMDGDGEYEIILKWSPSNEKDAASSGTTSPAIFDCIKLDGTRLWRIDMGDNFFTSAHTIQFIAWDFDGDGYGEFMVKTAPGTIDGEGNYVLLGDDDPHTNYLSGRGKQDHGPEYITVFDGTTGAELATIPYHTDYAKGQAYWGDSNQNRSERYLAGIAWLDGPNGNPSPIFARGYYSGAFVGAYDWDGTTLKERWVHRSIESGKGLWGEGAHWLAVGDCDGDEKQEIVYGSAALDHDGTLLYRTGLGHGDALHLGDFIPERPGLEVYMVHEKSPYGADLRDAKTGELIHHLKASGDTGRGIAGHFDTTKPHSQFSHSSDPGMHDCLTGERYSEGWNPGGGGSMNNRIYWDGDLYDEHYDKSCLAYWDSDYLNFGRIKVNNTNYTIGKLNNYTKYNPCVLGDILGDWREEIVLWDEQTNYLIINATSYPTEYRIPHLMDDLNYRAQVINQNCCYNQPPHLSFDPSVKYAGNPNVALQTNGVDDIYVDENGETVIYNTQGIRVDGFTTPGLYIVNGKKVYIK